MQDELEAVREQEAREKRRRKRKRYRVSVAMRGIKYSTDSFACVLPLRLEAIAQAICEKIYQLLYNTLAR